MELPQLVMLNCKLYTKYGTEMSLIELEMSITKPMDLKKMKFVRNAIILEKLKLARKATVDGREITIENYTNRSQEIEIKLLKLKKNK